MQCIYYPYEAKLPVYLDLISEKESRLYKEWLSVFFIHVNRVNSYCDFLPSKTILIFQPVLLASGETIGQEKPCVFHSILALRTDLLVMAIIWHQDAYSGRRRSSHWVTISGCSYNWLTAAGIVNKLSKCCRKRHGQSAKQRYYCRVAIRWS